MRGFSMLSELNKNKLLEIFTTLVQIPSPSLKEDKVIKWIQDFCKKNNIFCELDDYENVFIKIPATDKSKRPILFSSHMDVVGDDSPVMLKVDGDFIKTDGTRTLGADDKAGVACALLFALELQGVNGANQGLAPSPPWGEGWGEGDFSHGGLEIVFTRDEEHGMTGIKHVDYKKIQSKYLIVNDGSKLAELEVSGASYTNGRLKVTTPYGGHSGVDIHEKHRLNAAKLIAELANEIPQGVYYADETGTITSLNLGTIIAGDIQNIATTIVTEQIKQTKYLDYFMDNSVTNVINTEAQATYSIRSASEEKENELKALIEEKVKEFNHKYSGYATAEIVFKRHIPPFEKANDGVIEAVYKNACAKLGLTPDISSCHAGAETHVYAQHENAQGEKFLPVLLGLADIHNMHSASEKVNYKTLLTGYELLKQIFVEYNS